MSLPWAPRINRLMESPALLDELDSSRAAADLRSGSLRRGLETLVALPQLRQLAGVQLALAPMEPLLPDMEGLPLLVMGDLRLEIRQHLREVATYPERLHHIG